MTLDIARSRQDSLALWQRVRILTSNRAFFQPDPDVDECADSLALDLEGRYQVGDGNEFACEVREISPVGIRIKGQKEGVLGKWCTVHIASVGIVEGIVVQAARGSLVVGIIAMPTRIHRLARRLRWRLQQEAQGFADRRSSERVDMNRARATLRTADGKSFSCEVFDISDGGAALHLGSSALYFWVDQPIELDERRGAVLRYFPGGLVVKFD